jgi:cysteinyl-tRNA synthetase
MALQIFNVMGREKQAFVPLNLGRVGIYVCGPTVYELAHLGHAKSYVGFDVVVRWLRHSGYEVLYIQNITDVGHLRDSGVDPILLRAKQLQSLPMKIVETYTRSFFSDMDALGVQRPDISPRASAHVPEQIKMIETLLRKGFAYEVNGSVYFDVSKDADYGKLSNRRRDEAESGTRETVRTDEKRNPEDFAVWKRAEDEHILRWDSPWGEGFPGWHIECSAMAMKYLGPTFDIHGGGIDNLFPHNECEVAQSESANDAPFARYWMLVGSLLVDGVKMSKSLGNYRTIKDALSEYRPEMIRAFLLGAHYSNPVEYTADALHAAGSGWERLNNAARHVRRLLADAPTSDDGNGFLARAQQTRADFTAEMDDDFNTPKALAVLQDFTREANTLLNSGATLGRAVLAEMDAIYTQLGGAVLGVVSQTDANTNDAHREAGLIDLLISMRMQARKNKNYAEGDRIRDELAKLGVVLEDRAEGTVWRVG